MASAFSYWLEYIHELGTTQSLSMAICQAVVSKVPMHCKSAPRIGKLLGIEDFECLGTSAYGAAANACSEEGEAKISGQLESFPVTKAGT